MDIERLYRDHNIQYVTEGHRHARPGWVNTPCPFCTGNPGYHLGYDTEGNKFVCWRCGGHFGPNVISKLLSIGRDEANKILHRYGVLIGKAPQMKRKIKIKSFKLPDNTFNFLMPPHAKYLQKRGFNTAEVAADWNLGATSVSAKLGELDYQFRIIIPFIWDGKIVSFDSRDITGKAKNKYMACPEERELIGHKKILYGRQDKWGDVGICVEGPTDVWRMGFNSFAVSGIKYTPAQVRVMAKQFKRIMVLFDDDPQAIIQANKLVSDLKFRGIEAYRIDITGDPGALSQQKADYLVKQLIR